MSLEKENQVIPSPTVEKHKKKKKLTYDREFLLSLSKLDVCKKLPHGFDASILSEFADAPNSTYERRTLSQNRLESSGGYVRGSQGRWDTRSTGSSDKDGELQSDQEPLVQDTGRRFGNQTRRFGPNTEHDGLLGSGAFPRPSSHTGTSATKDQGNGQYHLSRSTVPYQPPRPYKAATYSRKDITDSHNDETFGSDERSSVDRAEEERKRRASFELMRKEQHKALQEKHKSNPQTCKENPDVDLFAMLANSADGKGSRSENKSDESVAASLFHNDSSRSSLHIQAPASRPLVPPGFASALMEKNISSSSAPRLEAGSGLVETDHSLYDIEIDQDKRNSSAALTHVNLGKIKAESVSVLFADANEKLVAQTSNAEVLRQEVGSGNVPGKTTGIQAAIEVWEDNINNDCSHRKASTSDMMNTASQDNSTTILEKLFSSALSKTSGSSPNSIEHQDVKVDKETWGTALSKSSKFAHWFPEEEKMPIEDFSSRGLLSLVSNDKIASRVSTSPNEKAIGTIPSGLPFGNIEIPPKLPMSLPTSSTFRLPEQYSQIDKKTPSSAVLTCEDLEQSILAEVTDSSPRVQPTIQGVWTAHDGNSIANKVDVDNHASQHILSLLQKGTSSKELVSSPGHDIFESSDRIAASNVNSGLNPISDNVVARNPEIVDSPEKSITLEALFGSAFMNALHSAEAPVSAKTGSVETVSDSDLMQPHRLPFSHENGGFFSSTSIESRSNRTIREGEMISFNNTQMNPDVSVPWVSGYNGSPIKGSKLHGMGIEEGEAVDIQLPEEDSLITVGDTLNPVTSDPFPFENAHKSELLRRNPVEDLNDRLLNSIIRDGEQLRTRVPEGPPLLHNGPFEMVDPDSLYHHSHGRPSSQYPHQMNQTRPLFPPLDHIVQRNVQMKFMGPDGLRRDPHLPFSGNSMPHHGFSNVSAPRFDPAIAHHPMLQHMPVPGNFPLHHPIQGLPRGISPSHPVNHMPGYVPGMNDIHFPMHQRQPNLHGSLGMGSPGSVGPGNGSHHPESLERLMEMEMRARSKQTHPGGHIPGIPGTYAPELDMNFRYR